MTIGIERYLDYDLAVPRAAMADAADIWIEQRADDKNPKNVGTTLFVASTDDPDRAMDVVRQDWRLAPYRGNPVILDNHNPMRVAGHAVKAEVPRKGDDAGKLMIRVRWDMENPDPTIRGVGHQHLRRIRRGSSVGFRAGARIARDKLDPDDKYYQDAVTVEGWFGSYKHAGFLFKSPELLEHSSATVPMNPRALQRSVDARDPAAQYLEHMMSLDPDDLDGRVQAIGETTDALTATQIETHLRTLLADPATASSMAALLWPDFLAQLRSDPEAHRVLRALDFLNPPPTEPESPRQRQYRRPETPLDAWFPSLLETDR